MNYSQREDLARKIGLFLVGQGLGVWDRWEGRLTKTEQLEAFGFYVDDGLIIVDGKGGSISVQVKAPLGCDVDNRRDITAQYRERFNAWDDSSKKRYSGITLTEERS